jgi:ketosteroid isomerase-like protein
MTEAELRTWMDAYTVAFNAQDSSAAANLFTEDGTYQWGPFGKLLVGRDEIRREWDAHQDHDEVAEMTYEVIAVTPAVGVARWIASHTNEREGRRHRMDGVFVVTLTEDGLCDSFREWWNAREEAL